MNGATPTTEPSAATSTVATEVVDHDAAAAAALQSKEARARAAEQARFAKDERVRAAQAAHDAAVARASDAKREAAAAQQERNAADARLRAALERTAHERATAAPPLEDYGVPRDAEEAEDFASADGGDPLLHATLLQHEAAALLNLHA